MANSFLSLGDIMTNPILVAGDVRDMFSQLVAPQTFG